MCDFKQTLGMQIHRNGMGYVSNEKKDFLQIEMYLAAEIIIIYQDFFSKRCIFSTTWIILSFGLRPRHIIKCIRFSAWLADFQLALDHG